jgi:trehalose/maltose transport system substrate-binding protein
MKERLLVIIVAVAVVFPLSSTWGGGSVGLAKTVQAPHAASVASAPAPPHDPNAAADKKLKGQSITFVGGSVGSDHTDDLILAKQFTKDTGIKVTAQAAPATGDAFYALLQRAFASGSSSIDAARIDVIWPGAFAQYLVDLKKAAASVVKLEDKNIIANDTVGGHLVALPYQGDFGLLWYRKDLLTQYGYSAPPTTWEQLTTMAKKIQDGEQKTNKNFYGYVFQGNSYEGLTCNALEWIASYGGGTFIDRKGNVTIDNAKAKAALKLAQSWVGTISPKGVTTYQEADTHGAFTGGNAAFARNWPYMASIAEASGSKIAGKWGTAPLPHGPGGHSYGTVGGWQAAVSKFSKHQAAAIAWVKYYVDKKTQIWRAVHSTIVPTMPSVFSVASVKKAMPFLAVAGKKETRATRPSTFLKTKYNQGSTIIYQGINQILTGSSVDSTVSSIASQLKNLHP